MQGETGPNTPGKQTGWPEAAKKFLEGFYTRHNATTLQERVDALENYLGKTHNVYAQEAVHIPDSIPEEEFFLRDIPEKDSLDIKLGALEHEILSLENLIDVTYF